MELTRYQLENGMNVLLLPNHSAPVVACNVWVGVGSADETPEEAGLAHVHEHMLFKGTQRRGVGQIAREVEAAGGHINAFTSFDQTCYYVVMSSRFVETGLDILSDAIRRSSFDADELGRELEVIQEEIKRGKDSPSRVAMLKLFEEAYEYHPYRLPVIGTSESVDSFERQNVLDFFHKHYVPENMTLVLVGDFEVSEGRDLVDRFFGDFQGESDDGYQRVIRDREPAQETLRTSVISEAAHDTHLRIGFHIPEATHEDIPALDLLGTIMGLGEASHLNQTIQREQQLVNSVYAGSYTPREAGLFMVSADYQLVDEGSSEPGAQSHLQVIESLLREVFHFHHMTTNEADLRRARTILESQAIYGKQTIEGLAMKLGHYQMVTGDPLFEERYYEALAEIDTAQLRDVATRYLRPENCTVVLSRPKEEEGESPSHDAIETSIRRAYRETHESTEERVLVEMDAPAPPRVDEHARDRSEQEYTLDEDGFVRLKIEGGPTLIVQENHDVEVFSARALVLGGLRMETPENNGINSLLADMITRGTPDRGAMEIAHRVESMAASISGISGRNSFGLAMSGLSRFLEPCLELFAECLFDASIPEDEFDREQRLQLQAIRSRQEQLGAVNFDLFARQFFGDYPYAMPSLGTTGSVTALTPQRLRDYKQQLIDPSALTLVVVGDVDAAQVVKMAERLFTGRERKESSSILTSPGKHSAPEAFQLFSSNLDKNQAFITVGFDAPTIKSEDRYPLNVIHSVLSGQGGRLFYELRDRQSLAYSVYASMLLGLDTSSFMVHIGTSPEKIEQATRGILTQIERLHREPPSVEEIEEAKVYLIGNHDIGLQRNSARAMAVALDELYDLGWKRSFSFGDRLGEVTDAQIKEVIARYLDPSRALIAITKPSETSIEGLEEDAKELLDSFE